MELHEEIITAAMCSAGSIITRFLPFFIFSPKKPTPRIVVYLGTALPLAVFALLIVYCLKDVGFVTDPHHGIGEIIGIAITVLLHWWKRQMMLSIAGGTISYMLLVQTVLS